jgi:hypothetical protein
MQDASGITSIKRINEMSKIEMEYVQKHDNNFEVDIPENIVVVSHGVFASADAEPTPVVRIDTRDVPRMGFSGGRFQIRR